MDDRVSAKFQEWCVRFPEVSDVNRLREAWRAAWREALARYPVADERAAYTDPLSDFQEGQWWVKELDELARAPGATHDQKRAVAVVHHMLRSAALASAPVAVRLPPRESENCGSSSAIAYAMAYNKALDDVAALNAIAPVADERIGLRGAANLAFNALHECKPAKGAEKQYSDAIQALQSALHDIAYTVNRTATPQQFAEHLQREARAALASAPVADERAAFEANWRGASDLAKDPLTGSFTHPDTQKRLAGWLSRAALAVADERTDVDLSELAIKCGAVISTDDLSWNFSYSAMRNFCIRARAALASAPVADIRIGVSATGQGATVCVMQQHADGTATVIYSEPHPLGDSVGRAALASTPVAGEATSVIPGRVHDIVRAGATIVLHMESAEAAQHAYNAIEGAHRVAVNIEQSVSPVAGEAVAWRVTHPRSPAPNWRDAARERPPNKRDVKQQDPDLILELAYAAPQAGGPDFADAYEGAREDLAIWKRRALEAESDLRAERETSSRLAAELNAQNGPTHMGEPAPQASEAVAYLGDNVAARLDNMADSQPPGSQAQSDLYAAATIYRKHVAHRATPPASTPVAGEAQPVAYQVRHLPASPEWFGCDRATYDVVRETRPKDARALYAAPQASEALQPGEIAVNEAELRELIELATGGRMSNWPYMIEPLLAAVTDAQNDPPAAPAVVTINPTSKDKP